MKNLKSQNFKRCINQDSRSGSAMVETAILMPIYIILVSALIFFGHSTLSRQRSRVTAHFISTYPEMLAPEEGMLANFGWSPSITGGYRLIEDHGSEFEADDAIIRAINRVVPDYYNPSWEGPIITKYLDTYQVFESRRLLEYVIITGAEPMGRWVWDEESGDFVLEEWLNLNYAASLLRDMGIASDLRTHDSLNLGDYNKYIEGLDKSINNIHGYPWIERRYSRMEYEYGPRALRYAIGEESMTSDQYLGLDFPEPEFKPLFVLESKAMTRGLGDRPGTMEAGASSIRGNMSYLLGAGVGDLQPPISLPELEALKNRFWPEDTGSIWVAK